MKNGRLMIVTKKEFVEGPLAETLRRARLEVSGLELNDEGDHARMIFTNGYQKLVSIDADSYASIIMDVTRAAMY